MADELERKFLVAALPPPDRLRHGARIRQGYLAVDGAVEVRVRVTDTDAVLTLKAGAGLHRTEIERPLRPDEAAALWEHTLGRRVEKTRHRLPLAGGLVAEVDLYDGSLAGLVVVEVEFASAALAAAFEPPSWFGEELTGDPAWSNAALARDGKPQ